jgi:hypothetical protein
MPIRPENRARYPKNWKEISIAVRARASNRCEGSPAFPKCRAPNRTLGYWRDDEFVPMPRSLREAGAVKGSEIACSDGTTIKIIEIVLTVAHLDHTPENCDLSNLKAWCKRCHLLYDREHHAQTASRTRREGKADGDLFQEAA